MVALVQAGRTPEELSREFEPTARSISNWVAQADRDEGKRKDGLTSAERQKLRRLRKGQPAAEAGAGDPGKSRGLVCTGDRGEFEAIFGFMKAHQATHPVRVMSRLLGVSASGFYAWLKRAPSSRTLQDIALTAKIHAIHRRSGGAYGAPVHAELADDHGVRIGRKRVARLMRAAGLKGLAPAKYVTTTVTDAESDRALDKVDRRFCAEGPDRLWVADITYVPTWAGFCISPSCWMCGQGASSAGPWLITSERRWCSMRWRWRSHSATRSRSLIIRTAAASTPAMRLANVAARPASCLPWDSRETLTITRRPRASLRHWSGKS